MSITGWDLVFRLGALWRIESNWQLGVMFQPPGIPVGKDGSIFRRTTSALPDMDDTFFLFQQGGFKTRTPIPFELRAGFENKPNALTTISFDASVNNIGLT